MERHGKKRIFSGQFVLGFWNIISYYIMNQSVTDPYKTPIKMANNSKVKSKLKGTHTRRWKTRKRKCEIQSI